MKSFFTTIFSLVAIYSFACSHQQACSRAGNVGISDSIDITHTTVHMSMDLEEKHMIAEAIIDFDVLVDGISSFKIDLMGFTIDSIHYKGNPISSTIDGYHIDMDFGITLSKGSDAVTIYYSGESLRDPVQDPNGNGWGGIWWTSNIAFNVGVAFKDSSHSYGRTLLPCFDNFVEKSTYEFYITTTKEHKASGPGLLQGTTSTDSTITWHWLNKVPISSYLVGISVGDFEFVERVYKGEEKDIPVVLFANKSDTSYLSHAFRNLDDMIALYEDIFGPYPFEKIGYSILPFSGGAMEHAENIAYPISMVRSASPYDEGVIAHELSHMWFGNWITTASPEEMYINEGFAAYCTLLFTEDEYGREVYDSSIHAMSDFVLGYAHVYDEGYHALNNVPNEYTYGNHTYNKGAMMLHSLRTYYNNDTKYFDCWEAYLNYFGGRSVGTDSLEAFLTDCSGMDLSEFVDPWIRDIGFVDLALRKNTIKPHGDGTYHVRTEVDYQNFLGKTPFKNIPAVLTYFDQNWKPAASTHFTIPNGCADFGRTLDFEPSFTAINWYSEIADGVFRNDRVITKTGSNSFSGTDFKFRVEDLVDSIYIRAERHFAMPSNVNVPSGYYISSHGYWTISGVMEGSVLGSFEFVYGSGDEAWMPDTEDDLAILYRKDASSAWTVITSELSNGSKSDGVGRIKTESVALGEYALASKQNHGVTPTFINHGDCEALLINDVNFNDQIMIYPNPSNGIVNVEFEGIESIQLFDVKGELLYESKSINTSSYQLNLPNVKGSLLLKVKTNSDQFYTNIVQSL